MQFPAFDEIRPPDRALANDCVHCGFCLPTCPTYVLWGEEMDSPRGRIHLMQQGLDGEPMTATMVQHFDRCLGCMACVTACPSGVRYGPLIEATRAQVERRYPRSRRERILRDGIFQLLPYARRLRLMRGPLRVAQRSGVLARVGRSRLLQRLAPPLASLATMAPPIVEAPRLPSRLRARGARRAAVGVLTGCVQAAFFPQVNVATARVLAAEGCDVAIPPGQGCCGALSMHAGREAEAMRFARRTIEAFEATGVETIVVNAAGCGSAMKEYGHLLREDDAWAQRAAAFSAKVRDFAEFLVGLGPAAPRHELPGSAVYQDACHLVHAQGIRAEPRALLATVPGLELREIAEAEICCGSAGVWNILNPGPAGELGLRKAANVGATGAPFLISGNPGCALQIARAARAQGQQLDVRHIAALIDASIRGTTL